MTHEKGVVVPYGYDLVLEVIPSEDACGYYFADHNTRSLFWLEDFDASLVCGNVHVVVSLSHLRKYIPSNLVVNFLIL